MDGRVLRDSGGRATCASAPREMAAKSRRAMTPPVVVDSVESLFGRSAKLAALRDRGSLAGKALRSTIAGVALLALPLSSFLIAFFYFS